MKALLKPAASMLLLLGASAPPAIAEGKHLDWQLIGTNPDVYAPAFPQPDPDSYFQRTQPGSGTFLRPRIAMSFAAVRNGERCERLGTPACAPS